MANTDYNTLAEINNALAKKQPELINFLLQDTPVLNKIPFMPASHPFWNLAERVTKIDSAGWVELNAKLPQMNMDTKLEKVDLGIMGGEMFVPEDKARALGGPDKFFAERAQPFLKTAGMTTERKLIYDNLRQFAIDNNNVIDAGGTGGNGYSMIAFRPVKGVNCGLYSPVGFESGAGIDVKKINDGALYKDEHGILGYGMRFKGYFGFQLKDPEAVSVIVNIKEDHIPTEAQIDDMLDDIRADSGSFICCHPKVLSLLNKYKGNILQAQSGDKNINRTFMMWNNIPFITSRNFDKGTEATVTVE